jgi:hypothetical protein
MEALGAEYGLTRQHIQQLAKRTGNHVGRPAAWVLSASIGRLFPRVVWGSYFRPMSAGCMGWRMKSRPGAIPSWKPRCIAPEVDRHEKGEARRLT